MKRFLYILCVTVSLAGLSACKKGSDPEPVAPVVGKWASDRVKISGLPAPYNAENGEYDAFTEFKIRTNIELLADKTFTGNDRSGGPISDFKGSWDYSGTDLTLKLSTGADRKLTYDGSTTPNRLLSQIVSLQDSIPNPTTKKIDVVKYNLQVIYSKQP